MKITDIEVITFRTTTIHRRSRWGFLLWDPESIETQESITKISTDEGVSGYMIGGDAAITEARIKPLLVGEDPLDREKLWTWMNQMVVQSPELGLNEAVMGVVDCALWDLFGRMIGQPVHKILGGARDRVKAYASTEPDLGPPEVYAEHVVACKERGYKAYKVHAYTAFDPHKWQAAPQHPGFPKEEIEVCRAVREAAGDDMVLMFDPFGVYTLEQALWVARELEKLDYYWLEHPMLETRMEAYRRLTAETRIAILAPEHVPGGVYAKAEWLLQRASNMLRIDYYQGGITGCHKLVNIADAYGVQCEMHGGGWASSQILGSTNESTCEYYERGLLPLDPDFIEKPEPYLKAICDPMDGDGNVILPQGPGLGMEFDWDYINDNLIESPGSASGGWITVRAAADR